MLRTALLLGLVSVAAATDVARHRIYNWTTYPGILAALALNGLGDLLVAWAGADPRRLAAWGWIGLSDSLVGLAVCGALMVACYVLFQIGGGDVKLMTMLGAWLGAEQGIMALLWTLVLGACTALVVLVWRVGPLRLLMRCLRQVFWTLRLGGWTPLTPDERAQLQPPLFLAPGALIAVILVEFGWP
jgi:prepilin peptidase CpaA